MDRKKYASQHAVVEGWVGGNKVFDFGEATDIPRDIRKWLDTLKTLKVSRTPAQFTVFSQPKFNSSIILLH